MAKSGVKIRSKNIYSISHLTGDIFILPKTFIISNIRKTKDERFREIKANITSEDFTDSNAEK